MSVLGTEKPGLCKISMMEASHLFGHPNIFFCLLIDDVKSLRQSAVRAGCPDILCVRTARFGEIRGEDPHGH